MLGGSQDHIYQELFCGRCPTLERSGRSYINLLDMQSRSKGSQLSGTENRKILS